MLVTLSGAFMHTVGPRHWKAIREWKELETARKKEKGYEATKWTENATGKSAAKNCNEEYVNMVWMNRDGRERGGNEITKCGMKKRENEAKKGG
jgi:hypothetical protein